MRRKIMISYIIIILLGTLITAMYSYHLAQKHYVSEVENKLLTVADIIKQEIISADSVFENDYLNNIAVSYGRATNIRVTFIDSKGYVLGDSIADYSTLENHKNRPEVIEALKSGKGNSIRLSTSVSQYLKYIAVIIDIDERPVVLRLSIPIEDINLIRKELISYIAVGVFAAFIIAVTLGASFAKKFTVPIKQLTDFSKHIAKGNLDGMMLMQSKDEIGELAHAFVDMQSRLKKYITQLSERNNEMEAILSSMIGGLIALDSSNKVILFNNTAVDMFEIKKKNIIGENILLVIRNNEFNQFIKEYVNTQQKHEVDIRFNSNDYRVYLSPINDKTKSDYVIGTLIIINDITNVRKLERIRSEFVTNVTHELKTPLTSIRGFIETLKSGAMFDEKVAEHFLDIIDIEAERLSNLISEILVLSEIENMKKDIKIGVCDVRSIVKEAISVVEQNAEKMDIKIHCSIAPELSMVNINRDRFKQVMINLLDNSIKYNNNGGQVWFECTRDNNVIQLNVRDNGIGIPKEHIPRLFERFHRIDKGRSRDQGGTGLGLSIVKHIVNLYNGEIEVKSKLGHGTEFIIKLPVAI